MRLTLHEINTFIQVFDAADPDAELYLFGSRVQDSLRGGDIDLLIHSTKIDKIQLRKIKWQLLELLGEQKIRYNPICRFTRTFCAPNTTDSD